MNFYLDFTDKRLEYLGDKFTNYGFNVFDFSCNLDKIKSEDVIVLPPAHKLSLEEAENLPNDVTIFSFNITDEVFSLFKSKSIRYINFMKDESFVLKNANLTAECVLCELLTHTKLSLYDMNILLLGGGRVAKALGGLFDKLKLNYHFTTLDREELKQNKTYYNLYINWNNFKENLKDYNIVINTIPALIFDSQDSVKFLKNSFVFEIASKKCLENVDTENFNYVSCPSLPSKYTPFSAGDLIEEVIKKHIKLNA